MKPSGIVVRIGLSRYKPPVPSALRSRPFALLFGAQSISLLGDVMFRIALPFAVLELTDSAGALGAVIAAQFLPFAVFALVGGAWADRLGRRRIMVASDLARTVLQAITGALLLAGAAQVWELAALSCLYGIADAFFQPALNGLVPVAAGRERLQEANALLATMRNVGMFVGAPLAGVLVAVLGPGTTIVADGATFLASAALLLRLPALGAVREEEHESTRRAIAAGWREVTARPWLRSFLGVLSAYHLLVLPAVFVVGPLIAQRSLDGARSWGLISGGFGVGAVVGSLVAIRWRPSRPMRACGVACAVGSCQAAIIVSGASTVAITALESVTGIAVSIAFILWETTLGEEIPEGSLSRVSSFDFLASVGVMPLGMALVGPAAEFAGLRATMIGATVVGALLSLAYAAQPVVRALPARATPGAAV